MMKESATQTVIIYILLMLHFCNPFVVLAEGFMSILVNSQTKILQIWI